MCSFLNKSPQGGANVVSCILLLLLLLPIASVAVYLPAFPFPEFPIACDGFVSLGGGVGLLGASPNCLGEVPSTRTKSTQCIGEF